MANTTYMKLELVPYEIEAARLVLRSWDPRLPGEAQRLFAAIDESREHLERWVGWHQKHAAVDDTRAWIRESRAKFESMSDFFYGLFARDDGRLVGGAGLHVRGEPVPFGFEIGYWLRASETGLGYAREATAALTRVAFDIAACDRVVIRADVDNRASRRVPEALHYPFEGVARASLRIHTAPTDAAMYAMTRADRSLLPE